MAKIPQTRATGLEGEGKVALEGLVKWRAEVRPVEPARREGGKRREKSTLTYQVSWCSSGRAKSDSLVGSWSERNLSVVGGRVRRIKSRAGQCLMEEWQGRKEIGPSSFFVYEKNAGRCGAHRQLGPYLPPSYLVCWTLLPLCFCGGRFSGSAWQVPCVCPGLFFSRPPVGERQGSFTTETCCI